MKVDDPPVMRVLVDVDVLAGALVPGVLYVSLSICHVRCRGFAIA